MINHVELQGYFGADPQLKKTQSGMSVLTFDLANQRPTKEKVTDWITCVAWNSAAETIAQYFRKGDEILVEGRLQVREWTDNDGRKHTKQEIMTSNFHFLKGRKTTTEAVPDDLDGELPF